ncbi:MAG: hydantoinase/oxoprolinase family protein [Eubacteriaceae bacterium]|nr:hydantoinase/oxoprolinase family protein [Eubacteriaceae bacterium]
MNLAIGIDTGGTYTDGVLIDPANKSIIKSMKTPTTHEDLTVCITAVFDELLEDNKDIGLVCLSTTLATNACAEGRGGRCKLILFGSSPEDVDSLGAEVGLMKSSEIYFAKGSVSMRGEISLEPDWEEFRRDFSRFMDDYDSFAIVQMWGMKNPVLELTARDIIGRLTDKSVVCGCELSSKLNYLRRAVSAYLNGRLTPIFNDFMDSVRKDLLRRGITPKICVVRGDGSIMSEEYARRRPVETLLSGPAASVLGAAALCEGASKAVIIDMGGTTSDAAVIGEEGITLSDEGASVGGFSTSTRAIDITTQVLGGDVEILFEGAKPHTGTRRITPLCVLAETHPEIKKYFEPGNPYHISGSMDDLVFYYPSNNKTFINRDLKDKSLSVILEAIGKQAVSMSEIRRRCGSVLYSVRRLYEEGFLEKGGLTPTDFMHIRGDFNQWNREVSLFAASHCASLKGISVDMLTREVYDCVVHGLYSLTFRKLALKENTLGDITQSEAYNKMVDFSYYNSGAYMKLKLTGDYKIIGIGAPASIFIPLLRDHTDMECLVPERADVGNAVGAVLGKIETVGLMEVTRREEVFEIIGPYGVVRRNIDFEESLEIAKEEALALALDTFAERGGKNASLSVTVSKNEKSLSAQSAVVAVKASCSILDLIG